MFPKKYTFNVNSLRFKKTQYFAIGKGLKVGSQEKSEGLETGEAGGLDTRSFLAPIQTRSKLEF